MKYIKKFEVKKFGEWGYETLEEQLISACQERREWQSHYIKIVKDLIAYDININYKNKNGCTALIYAVFGGCIDICKYLIDHGADVNIQNNYGYTAIIYAAQNKKWNTEHKFLPILDVINLLIESGADWNIKKDGKDFLYILGPVMAQEIINRYPIEYKKYLEKKEMMDNVEKYNL